MANAGNGIHHLSMANTKDNNTIFTHFSGVVQPQAFTVLDWL